MDRTSTGAESTRTYKTGIYAKSNTKTDFVLTVFWANNFDMTVDAHYGSGAIIVTYLMKFEVTDRTEHISNKVNVTKSKRQSQ